MSSTAAAVELALGIVAAADMAFSAGPDEVVTFHNFTNPSSEQDKKTCPVESNVIPVTVLVCALVVCSSTGLRVARSHNLTLPSAAPDAYTTSDRRQILAHVTASPCPPYKSPKKGRANMRDNLAETTAL